MEYSITEISHQNKAAVLELLAASDLVKEDVLAEGTRYWGAHFGGKLIGVIGCEYQGRHGLLRTAFVQDEYRGRGIAAKLMETAFDAARDMGLEAVYLFSTDAGPYWLKQGFKIVPVDEVIEKLYDCWQVKLFDRLGWLPTEVTYKYPLTSKEKPYPRSISENVFLKDGIEEIKVLQFEGVKSFSYFKLFKPHLDRKEAQYLNELYYNLF